MSEFKHEKHEPLPDCDCGPCARVARDRLRSDLAAAREALQKIARGPVKPPPDPGAHSWQAYASYWMAAATDMKFSAIRALAAALAEPKEASGFDTLPDDYEAPHG